MTFPPSPEVRNERLFATLLGSLVFGAGLVLDVMMLHWGLAGSDALVVSNLLTGVVAGIACWMLMIREREQRDEAVQRLHVISDMNHHVRNALQVIVYYCSQMEQEPRSETEHAIERIKWSLTAVLPQVQRTEELAEALQTTKRTT
jgi:hypothetical protein